FQRLPPRSQLLLSLFGQGLHFLLVHRPIVFERDEPEAHRGLFESEPTLVAEGREFVTEGLFFPYLVLDDFCFGVEVFLPFKGGRNITAKPIDERSHLAFERGPLSGRKRKAGGAGGIVKAVDI